MSNLGGKRAEKTRAKMSAAQIGHAVSEKTREKMSQAKILRMQNNRVPQVLKAKREAARQLRDAEERLAITNQALSAAEGHIHTMLGKMTPQESDEAVIVLGELRHNYQAAERDLTRLRREAGK